MIRKTTSPNNMKLLDKLAKVVNQICGKNKQGNRKALMF